MMTVGIVGLGLIGGSLAKAYKRSGDVRILAYDTNRTILDFAVMFGDVDEELTKENIASCELLLLAAYPDGAEAFLENAAPDISPDTVVVDCLGTKRRICRSGFALAEKYGFTFAGGHPMAGTHNSGYKFASEEMFDGAPMVITAREGEDIETLDRVISLLRPAGFGSFSFTTPEEHDRMIAFTSQLAHVVSNAYIKSPSAGSHKGFSAGSYKDLTRVAWLNPAMWAELFIENGDNLNQEIAVLMGHLEEYRTAIEEKDKDRLEELLSEGARRKKEIDG